MSRLQNLRFWALRIKSDAVALWFVLRHPDTPIVPKLICSIAVAYALSPIDLIPDFIPILGYLDDVILLPGLIWLAVRLTPVDLITACRSEAGDWMAHNAAKPTSYGGAAAVVTTWLVALVLAWYWLA